MNPQELVEIARILATDQNRRLGSTRYLAAALLLRQALEDAIDSFWQSTLPAMESLSARAQLITLPFYINPALAAQVQFTWYQLSATCHHDAYDLPPPLHELESAAETVMQLVGSDSTDWRN
jgi:hypothetical protein